jgi:hypothetical protein
MTPISWMLAGTLFVIITAFPLRTSLRSGVVHLRGAAGPTLRDRLDCPTHEVLEYDRKSAKIASGICAAAR